jgi:hypothetical protein
MTSIYDGRQDQTGDKDGQEYNLETSLHPNVEWLRLHSIILLVENFERLYLMILKQCDEQQFCWPSPPFCSLGTRAHSSPLKILYG